MRKALRFRCRKTRGATAAALEYSNLLEACYLSKCTAIRGMEGMDFAYLTIYCAVEASLAMMGHKSTDFQKVRACDSRSPGVSSQ